MTFHYFTMLVWHYIMFERYSSWSWSLRTSSIQYHSNPVLVPPHKPPYLVVDLYDGQIYELKTRVNIWTSMDVITVDYGIFYQMFCLKMWSFQFIPRIDFRWYYVLLYIVALLVWSGLWTKLRIYMVPPDQGNWCCKGFVSLCQEFVIMCMILFKKDIIIFY